MIKITREELDKLLNLTKVAQTTPVIGFSVRQMLSGEDLSRQAWYRVKAKWRELGKKYGFNPQEVRGINATTGEVLL